MQPHSPSRDERHNSTSAATPLRHETADQPVLLMCPPELYDVTYVINPWMAGNLHRSSRERALAQWRQLHGELSRLARVLLIDPVAGSPDMVFTANAGLVRGRSAAVSSFFHPERQGEEPHFRRWFREAGYDLVDLPRETPFEGEGDALFSEDGSRLWVGHGPRTSVASHMALRQAWNVDVVSLHLVDPRFYHLDTCFAPLAGGYVLFYPEAFDPLSRTHIDAFYPREKQIRVKEADAVCFACNAVNLGTTIVMNTVSDDLRERLAVCGFHVIEVPLDEFLKAGGAAKCLVLQLTPAMHRTATEGNAAVLTMPLEAPTPSSVEISAMAVVAAEALAPARSEAR